MQLLRDPTRLRPSLQFLPAPLPHHRNRPTKIHVLLSGRDGHHCLLHPEVLNTCDMVRARSIETYTYIKIYMGGEQKVWIITCTGTYYAYNDLVPGKYVCMLQSCTSVCDCVHASIILNQRVYMIAVCKHVPVHIIT